MSETNNGIDYPFWLGGAASCVAACITHPLDLTKVRMQTEHRTKSKFLTTIAKIARNEGFLALYNGLSASILRQATYSTVRFGAYDIMKTNIEKKGYKESPEILISMALASGMMGGAVGNPADIINVRMQNDLSMPPEKRKNYRHALDGLVKLTRNEGITAWAKGITPNIFRSMLMTGSQFVSYDEAKSKLLHYKLMQDGMPLHFTSSFLAALVATTVTSPVDVIKTRIMSSAHNQGIIAILGDGLRKEGPTFLFKGWTAAFTRLGPHTIATFVVLEQLKKVFRMLKTKNLDI